jgi:hypothetical protein
MTTLTVNRRGEISFWSEEGDVNDEMKGQINIRLVIQG